jgi:hypothetical protein
MPIVTAPEHSLRIDANEWRVPSKEVSFNDAALLEGDDRVPIAGTDV